MPNGVAKVGVLISNVTLDGDIGIIYAATPPHEQAVPYINSNRGGLKRREGRREEVAIAAHLPVVRCDASLAAALLPSA